MSRRKKYKFRDPQPIQKYTDYIIQDTNTTCCPTVTANKAVTVYRNISVKDGVPVSASCSFCRRPLELPEITEEMFIECGIMHERHYRDMYSRFLFKGEAFEGWPVKASYSDKRKRWKVVSRAGMWDEKMVAVIL